MDQLPIIEKINLHALGIDIFVSGNDKPVLVITTPERDCCEDFGVEVYYNKYSDDKYIECTENECNKFIGWKINDVEYHEGDPSIYSGVYKRDFVGYLVLHIFNEMEIVQMLLIPYNNHNGYYPHTFLFKYYQIEKLIEIGKSPINMDDVVEQLWTI